MSSIPGIVCLAFWITYLSSLFHIPHHTAVMIMIPRVPLLIFSWIRIWMQVVKQCKSVHICSFFRRIKVSRLVYYCCEKCVKFLTLFWIQIRVSTSDPDPGGKLNKDQDPLHGWNLIFLPLLYSYLQHILNTFIFDSPLKCPLSFLFLHILPFFLFSFSNFLSDVPQGEGGWGCELSNLWVGYSRLGDTTLSKIWGIIWKLILWTYRPVMKALYISLK